jgi:DNA-binding transcriptional regulator YiaG
MIRQPLEQRASIDDRWSRCWQTGQRSIVEHYEELANTTFEIEERSLQELRQAHKLTQKRMAHVLGIGQDSVSRLEQRSDLLISTLRGYIEALGGRLSLVAEFPNHKPVVLTGIAALEGASVINGRKG